jgi:hypothetical protein
MKSLPAIAVLLLASAASAQLVVNPSHATLVPGQEITVAVSNHAGFTLPYPLYANYSVSGPLAIERVDTGMYGGKLVLIRALAAGDGTLIADTLDGKHSVIATFNVTTCANAEPKVTLSVKRFGDEIDATAIGTPEAGTYEWFFGRVGDTSNRIPSQTFGFVWFYVLHGHEVDLWVRYSTPCGAATAQGWSSPPRRRPARH